MKVAGNSITVFGWAWSTNCNAVYLNPFNKLYHISPRLACTVLLISQSWFNRICCNKSSKKVKVTGINWISIKHLYSGSIVQYVLCIYHSQYPNLFVMRVFFSSSSPLVQDSNPSFSWIYFSFLILHLYRKPVYMYLINFCSSLV